MIWGEAASGVIRAETYVEMPGSYDSVGAAVTDLWENIPRVRILGAVPVLMHDEAGARLDVSVGIFTVEDRKYAVLFSPIEENEVPIAEAEMSWADWISENYVEGMTYADVIEPVPEETLPEVSDLISREDAA